MSFSYSDYCDKFLLFPILCILSVVPMLIPSIKALVQLLISSVRFDLDELGKRIFPFIIIIGLICISISGLTSGAILLLTEDEASAIEAKGVISEIEKVGKYEYQITVSDAAYTIIDIGDYKVGDAVVIKYLPNSKYVLSLQSDS